MPIDSKAWTGRTPPDWGCSYGHWGLTYGVVKFSIFEGGGVPFNIHFHWDSVKKHVYLYVCFSWRRGWRFYRHWDYGR